MNKFIQELAGFNVVGVTQSFAHAQSMVDIVQPNLIILDNYFPDGLGTDLLQYIRKQKIQTDIIMVTASKEASTIRDALYGGIFDYIIKPVTYDRLAASLNKYHDYFSKVQNAQKLGQNEVDELLKRNQSYKSMVCQRLPKGIDPTTLEKIRKEVEIIEEKFTADHLGKLIGISRSTSRRYLEYLVSIKVIVADLNYGSVGRPERLYIKNNYL
jgi:two-component system CitB family response regulator